MYLVPCLYFISRLLYLLLIAVGIKGRSIKYKGANTHRFQGNPLISSGIEGAFFRSPVLFHSIWFTEKQILLEVFVFLCPFPILRFHYANSH